MRLALAVPLLLALPLAALLHPSYAGPSAPAAPEARAADDALLTLPSTVAAVDGRAAFRSLGICTVSGDRWSCTGDTTATPAPFATDVALEDVTLTLTWAPDLDRFSHGEIHAGLFRDGALLAMADGPSPLALHLDALDAGTYEVQVWPASGIRPLPDIAAAWSLTGAPVTP
ncbi:MAG TPA: hypothetical protein VM370_12380 [Candidatus Thermoplasmatota archaeon]|nr:hypothetical protein [Candidatus Thermoplasmatota archaeon]